MNLFRRKYWIPVHLADRDGMVGVGGDLDPRTLLAAYQDGVFPWYSQGDPILWWSPDPRAVMEFENFHVSRSLAKTIRQNKFRITFDTDFPRTMYACGANRPEGTWINSEMLSAYSVMHRLGYAHSVEAWQGGELVGGVYGVGIASFFSAESMFHTVTDASKVALAALMERLQSRGYTIVDLQILNEHTRSLGATEISREAYVKRIKQAMRKRVGFG